MATYWENSCSFSLRYVSWYKYLIVGLVFSRLGFWSGNLFLIAPFPDLCLLVPFYVVLKMFNLILTVTMQWVNECQWCVIQGILNADQRMGFLFQVKSKQIILFHVDVNILTYKPLMAVTLVFDPTILNDYVSTVKQLHLITYFI